MAESLLFSTTRLSTYRGRQLLTGATGFFFENDGALFLVSSRHVLHDDSSGHFPDRVELVLHVDAKNLTRTTTLALPLYQDQRAVWRVGKDSGGEVDVAALPLDRAQFPAEAVISAFTPGHLLQSLEDTQVGDELLVVGFPLGFFDTLHQLPVARHATVASAFGVRFQGQGYFVTDARLHRGTSGAPVVARDASLAPMPWRLVGVHAARMDMRGRDEAQDETLGLNCAWYADILLTLTSGTTGGSNAQMRPRGRQLAAGRIQDAFPPE
jgi:hypothetical protein